MSFRVKTTNKFLNSQPVTESSSTSTRNLMNLLKSENKFNPELFSEFNSKNMKNSSQGKIPATGIDQGLSIRSSPEAQSDYM
jgi:hypothetical protein